MATLREVKSWMTFWGWTREGSPKSVKKDHDGKIIACHGDAHWEADVECARGKRGREKPCLSK